MVIGPHQQDLERSHSKNINDPRIDLVQGALRHVFDYCVK
jgi:hypothetical protein